MRLMYIPEIGDVLQLAEDWTFDLQYEGRNNGMWTALGLPEIPRVDWRFRYEAYTKDEINKMKTQGIKFKAIEFDYHYRDHIAAYMPVTLPKSTQLKIDRIYIRKGAEDFSSVTFIVQSSPMQFSKGKKRFWVHLSAVNVMKIEDKKVVLSVEEKKVTPKYTAIYRYVYPYSDFDRSLRRRYEFTNVAIYSSYFQSIKTGEALVEYAKNKHGENLIAIVEGRDSYSTYYIHNMLHKMNVVYLNKELLSSTLKEMNRSRTS